MSGAAGRRKGREGENEFARIAGGHRCSEAGISGPDVVALGQVWEVKRRRDGLTNLYDAVKQAIRNGGHLVATRQDGHGWLVVMRFEDYKEIYAHNGHSNNAAVDEGIREAIHTLQSLVKEVPNEQAD